MINDLYGFKKSYENETQAVRRQHSHMCVSGSDLQQPVLTSFPWLCLSWAWCRSSPNPLALCSQTPGSGP